MFNPNVSLNHISIMEEYNVTYAVLPYNTTSHETVSVQLYSLLVNCGCLIFLALPGIILNLGVLISTRCKKGIRNLQYGLHYTLFLINVLFCLVWMPIKATELYFSYQGNGMSNYFCYISVALFHFCLASIVFLAVVLGVLHLHYLSSSPVRAIRSLVKRGIGASLFTASLLTLFITIEHPYNVSFEVCTNATASHANTYRFWYSLLSILLAIPYLVMLLVMMVLLWLAVQALRQRIHELIEQARNCNRQLDSLQENQESTYEVSREEPSKHSSVTFKEPDIAETIPNKNGIKKMSNSVTHKGIKFQEVATSNDENETDDEDNEDEFDLKMRLKLQKSSSGRRHTVANIGLGDVLFGSKRRGSFDVQRSPTVPQHYNYIRKWSVDITALQNQLENPKIHTGSYPFRELGILPEKETSPQEEQSHEEESNNPEKSVSIAQPTPETSAASEQVSDRQECRNSDVRELSSVNEVPSIVIDEGLEDSGWQTSQDGNQGDEEDNNHIDEEVVHRFHKQLKKSKLLILFYMLTFLSLLPCLLILIIQGTLTGHLGVNLVHVTSPICLLSTIFQPLVLIWMDTRLKQAITRLWNKMTHWKCVCYCNIGSGKKFFGKPVEIDDKSSDT